MKSIDRAIHIFVFICLVGYLVWLSTSIYKTIQFIRTRKEAIGLFIPLVEMDAKMNNVPFKIRYYNSYHNEEVEGLLSADRIKFQELRKADKIVISYGKFSDDIFIKSYKEPNKGRLTVSIMSFVVVFLIIMIYVKRFRKGKLID